MLYKRIIGQHKKDCYAIKNYINGRWDTPWAAPWVNRQYYGTATGKVKNRNTHLWTEFQCNCVGCPARFIVHSSIMEELVK